METLRTEKIQVDKQARVFITRTALKSLTSESTVEKVISFQFKDLLRALKTYSSIEISGFGRFFISQNKLRRRLETVYRTQEAYINRLKGEMSDSKREYTAEIVVELKEDIEYLTKRLKDEA